MFKKSLSLSSFAHFKCCSILVGVFSSIFLFTQPLSCEATSYATFAAPHSILVLTPDPISIPYLYDFYSAFKAQLNQGRIEPIIVYPENLDLTRFQDQTYRERLGVWLKRKYAQTKIDAIVVVGHTALKYVLNDGKPLWTDIPIFFTLASDVEVAKIVLPNNVTGKTIRADFADIVNMAKTILPDTQSIALVGNAPAIDIYRTYLPAQIARMSEQIKIIDLRGKPYTELKDKVSSLPEHTLIYFTILTYDSEQKKSIAHAEALEEIARVANRPILTDDPTTIGQGPLGVTSFDPKAQGRDTALLLNHILNGNDISQIPVSNSAYTPLLDWRQLERWGINQKNLPKNSELRFYTPPIWQLFRWQILTTLGVITLLLMLLLTLLIERQRRAKAVEVARQRLVQIAHMNRKFTASMYSEVIAHELIQPLAAILGNVEAAQMFLQNETPNLDLVQQTLTNIRRDDMRASDLIKSMRSFLKKSETTISQVDIHHIIKNVLKFLSDEAKTRQLQFVGEFAPTALLVAVDVSQLQQVLINLLLNAADAIDEKADALRCITIRTTASDKNAVIVSIHDTGTGFGENLVRVFEAFFTTKTEGLGLGLSITEAIVHAHGGQIWAENANDGGIIHFQLPLIPDVVQDVIQETSV